MQAVANLRQLSNLELVGFICEWEDDTPVHCTQLTSLALQCCEVAAPWLATLTALRALEYSPCMDADVFDYCNEQALAFEVLGTLSHLTSLTFSGEAAVPGSALRQLLQQLPGLRRLSLEHCEENCEFLPPPGVWSERLEELTLGFSTALEASSMLTRMPALRSLVLLFPRPVTGWQHFQTQPVVANFERLCSCMSMWPALQSITVTVSPRCYVFLTYPWPRHMVEGLHRLQLERPALR